MDSEEKDLWEMLTSKFTGKELIRVLELIVIDSKKHQKEQFLNSRLHGVSCKMCNDKGSLQGRRKMIRCKCQF